ncbi:MAG: putative concanavalin A-like lectin/glucanases superfamily protein [Prokaryotic dsDNA virus sp.]|jgi:hypothetical protein|nr:MAG: putative concanavalin A-like lectin/glucanases superfamily protein [Prokaryotic dsDNA virus sp.]|tara:strand:- start:73380 stop:75959 length:2580 start_codon:yes stop_codon:yes gene_type:complete
MSLISYYKLDGNALDELNRLDGSPSGVVWSNGLSGQCAEFDGVNDLISFGSGPDFFPHKNFSLSIWFKSFGTTPTTGTTPAIFGFTYGVLLRVLSNRLQFGIDTGSDFQYIFSPSTYDFYNDDTWHNVIICASANEMRMYLDGELVGSAATTWAGNTRWTNSVVIGRDLNNSNYFFRGLMDDFRIYDHVVSEKEAKDIYRLKVLHKLQEELDNTADSGNTITVPDSPTILGDTSIEFWFYPTNNSRRQTIWNKGYGGEGTINFEPTTNYLRFYSGPNGDNSSGYVAIESSTGIALNQWHHAVIVRDMKNQTWQWYLDGVPDIQESFSFTSVGETTFDLTIGTGYTSDFVGKLRGVRQYARVLTDSEVEALYTTGLSIDNFGSIHSNYFVESGVVTPNILDYKTWVVGTSGSQVGFSANGSASESYIVEDVDPFSKSIPVWEARPDSVSGADGGWNGDLFSVDTTKFYRFSVWIRRTVVGNGSAYLGLSDTGGTVLQRADGSANSNPYFWSGGWSYGAGEWILFVGHVWPEGSGFGAFHPDSGIYSVSGGRLGDIQRDFVWVPEVTNALHRTYLYYSTDTSTRQQWCYPRVDVLDGTEPSIEALLAGFDSINGDRIDELGASDVPDNFGVKYEKTNVGELNEVGTYRGLGWYIPFKYSAKSFSETPNVVTDVEGATIFNGESVHFSNTTNETVEVSDLTNILGSSTTSATFSVWINRTASNNTYNMFMGQGTLYFSFRSSNQILWSMPTTAGQQTLTTSQTYSSNEWLHCVFVIDGTTAKVYVNGEQKASRTVDSPVSIANTFSFGDGRDSAWYPFQGYVKDFKVFNVSLSGEEVYNEYSSNLKASINKNTAFAKEFIEV